MNATTGQLPAGAFAAARDKDGTLLYVCRPLTRNYVGYFTNGSSCVSSMSGVMKDNSFEVLTGTGFDWAIQDGGYQNVPANAYQVGSNPNPVYVVRFFVQDTAFIGKLTDDGCWYADQSGHQPNDCSSVDVLLC